MTQGREVMSPPVTIVDVDSNIEQTAEVSAEGGFGAVPVRGAIVRLVANGLRGSPSRKSPPDDSAEKPQRP